VNDATTVAVIDDADVVTARQVGRELAMSIGFSGSDQTSIATAISEIARNIVVYAGTGEMRFRIVEGRGRSGLEIVAEDNGPGIPDIEKAMQDGYSTGRSLGLGLPGARRLMDEFEIVSTAGLGTRIRMAKWRAQ
jgi:serine/threonine-protein kinase RsbT